MRAQLLTVDVVGEGSFVPADNYDYVVRISHGGCSIGLDFLFGVSVGFVYAYSRSPDSSMLLTCRCRSLPVYTLIFSLT